MKYQVCSGVVLVSVCGENMLIATREARGKVGYVKHLNEDGAYLWSLFEKQMDIEQIIQKVVFDYEDTEERVRPLVLKFTDVLSKAGYLTMDGEVE